MGSPDPDREIGLFHELARIEFGLSQPFIDRLGRQSFQSIACQLIAG